MRGIVGIGPTATRQGGFMAIEFRDSLHAVYSIQQHFGLNDDQMKKLIESPQLHHILEAVHWVRWDQVTVMLYQDDILERKSKK